MFVHLWQMLAGLVFLTAACGGPEPRSEFSALRVGISGDLPPYSEAIAGTYVGIDIDLARDLGASMDRPVEFVQFSWPRLLADIVDRRFDLAMGVYVTPAREAAALFTHPYLNVGEQAVVRCQDVARFQRIEEVNRMGVRILSTRGGATRTFIRQHLPNATFVAVDDSRNIFDLLAAGEGDLTFGSTLRAKYAARHDSRLCVALGGTAFGNQPIAVLMPKNSPHHRTANRWLRRRARDGFIARVVQIHVEP